MRLACAGKGKIGIPRKVGCEYVRADRKRKRRKNPMKYRMIDPPAPKKADVVGNVKVIGILALIGIGIYFAQANASGV
jgi:hypothetical protein